MPTKTTKTHPTKIIKTHPYKNSPSSSSSSSSSFSFETHHLQLKNFLLCFSFLASFFFFFCPFSKKKAHHCHRRHYHLNVSIFFRQMVNPALQLVFVGHLVLFWTFAPIKPITSTTRPIKPKIAAWFALGLHRKE